MSTASNDQQLFSITLQCPFHRYHHYKSPGNSIITTITPSYVTNSFITITTVTSAPSSPSSSSSSPLSHHHHHHPHHHHLMHHHHHHCHITTIITLIIIILPITIPSHHTLCHPHKPTAPAGCWTIFGEEGTQKAQTQMSK